MPKHTVCLVIKCDILCFLSLGYALWNYILGKLVTQFHNFQNSKKANRIMEEYGNRVLCRNLFKILQILPLTSQYTFNFIKVCSSEQFFFQQTMKITIQTLEKKNVYLPQEIFTISQKAAYYLEIKFFNTLSLEIKKVACQR